VGDECGAIVEWYSGKPKYSEKSLFQSLCSTRGRACNLTLGFAASNPQSGGASCLYSTWRAKLFSAVEGSV
jgi:hypothetical protein